MLAHAYWHEPAFPVCPAVVISILVLRGNDAGVLEFCYGAGFATLIAKYERKASDSVRKKWNRNVSSARLRAFDLAEDMEGPNFLI